jgi:hypothetical protein
LIRHAQHTCMRGTESGIEAECPQSSQVQSCQVTAQTAQKPSAAACEGCLLRTCILRLALDTPTWRGRGGGRAAHQSGRVLCHLRHCLQSWFNTPEGCSWACKQRHTVTPAVDSP